MKPIIRILLAGLIACAGSAAQATVLTYHFQAKVSQIAEIAGTDGDVIFVTESDLAGTPVGIGDIVTGSFQYDTSAPAGKYQPDQQSGSTYRNYDSGANDSITYVDQTTGLAFTSQTSLNWLGSTSIQDSVAIPDAYAADYFSMLRGRIDDSMVMGANIFLVDLDGNALQSTALPEQLSLAAFPYSSMSGSFLRMADNFFMTFSADITALERVDANVPEPSSALLFAIAAGGLFGLRRIRRA